MLPAAELRSIMMLYIKVNLKCGDIKYSTYLLQIRNFIKIEIGPEVLQRFINPYFPWKSSRFSNMKFSRYQTLSLIGLFSVKRIPTEQQSAFVEPEKNLN